MAQQKSIYRRLTGRKRSPFGYSQLWLAADHVLLVKSSRFAEQYKRFALADIQAIVITALPDRTVLQTGEAAAAILWTLLLLTVSLTFAKLFFAVTGAIGLAVVLVDVARGPRCRCHLHTAVSRELLAPVSRERAARKFLDTIQPPIEAVQGRIAPDTIAEVLPAATAILDQPPEVPQAPGYLPEVLFGLFLLNAVVLLVDSRFPQTEAASVLPTTMFGEAFLLIVALARRGSRDPRRVIYALMVVAIAFVGWDATSVVRGVGGWFTAVVEAGKRGLPPVRIPVNAFPHANVMFAAGWRMAIGVVGLIAAWMERPAETSI